MEDKLHDAEIFGVSVDRLSEYARLDFRLESGSFLFAEMKGLRAFRCEDMTLQNVISRMLRSDMNQIAPAALEGWLSWCTSLSDTHSWLCEERRREWLRECQNGSLILVIVEPSAGAQIAAVCEHLLIQPCNHP
jgi:hypothetical protein